MKVVLPVLYSVTRATLNRGFNPLVKKWVPCRSRGLDTDGS